MLVIGNSGVKYIPKMKNVTIMSEKGFGKRILASIRNIQNKNKYKKIILMLGSNSLFPGRLFKKHGDYGMESEVHYHEKCSPETVENFADTYKLMLLEILSMFGNVRKIHVLSPLPRNFFGKSCRECIEYENALRTAKEVGRMLIRVTAFYPSIIIEQPFKQIYMFLKMTNMGEHGKNRYAASKSFSFQSVFLKQFYYGQDHVHASKEFLHCIAVLLNILARGEGSILLQLSK